MNTKKDLLQSISKMTDDQIFALAYLSDIAAHDGRSSHLAKQIDIVRNFKKLSPDEKITLLLVAYELIKKTQSSDDQIQLSEYSSDHVVMAKRTMQNLNKLTLEQVNQLRAFINILVEQKLRAEQLLNQNENQTNNNQSAKYIGTLPQDIVAKFTNQKKQRPKPKMTVYYCQDQCSDTFEKHQKWLKPTIVKTTYIAAVFVIFGIVAWLLLACANALQPLTDNNFDDQNTTMVTVHNQLLKAQIIVTSFISDFTIVDCYFDPVHSMILRKNNTNTYNASLKYKDSGNVFLDVRNGEQWGKQNVEMIASYDLTYFDSQYHSFEKVGIIVTVVGGVLLLVLLFFCDGWFKCCCTRDGYEKIDQEMKTNKAQCIQQDV